MLGGERESLTGECGVGVIPMERELTIGRGQDTIAMPASRRLNSCFGEYVDGLHKRCEVRTIVVGG